MGFTSCHITSLVINSLRGRHTYKHAHVQKSVQIKKPDVPATGQHGPGLKIVIPGAQGLLMSLGSKCLMKMTRPQNIKIKRTMFCSLVIIIKTFDPINIRRPWAPEITIFCSEVTRSKLPNLSKSGGLGCFSSWPPFFTPGVFLVRFHSFFKEIINFISHTQKKFKVVASVI